MAETDPQHLPGKTRRWKRTAAAALLLLAGGAVVNVAVAWVEVCRSPSQRGAFRAYAEANHHRLLSAEQFLLAHRAHQVESDLPESVLHWLTVDDIWSMRESRTCKLQVRYSRSDEISSSTFPRDDYRLLSGWPMYSMTTGWRDVHTFKWFERREVLDVLGLLRHPLWPGFIINTLVYALLLWLLIFAPFAARRMLRRRRGQCEKCAYPIGVSPVCTECGAAVVRRVESTT